MKNNRKGQFFIAALVVLAFSVFLIFTYVQTTSSSEISSFQRSAERDFLNIVNVVEELNESNINDWYDVNWKYRQRIVRNVNHMCSVGATPYNYSFDAMEHMFTNDCTTELVGTRVDDPFNTITLNTTPGTNCVSVQVICSVSQDADGFYVYYGNENGGQSNQVSLFAYNNNTATTTEENLRILNCTQIERDYGLMGYSVRCTESQAVPISYLINFSSLNFNFSGNVS